MTPGLPFDKATKIGPLISKEHQRKVLSYFQKARDEGATVVTVAAPIQRNRSQENEAIKHGQVPKYWNASKRAQKDTDARWTKKHGKSYFGYKVHANTDRRWGFVRVHTVTPANVHDSQQFDAVLDRANTSRTIRADSAYASGEREAAHRCRGDPR